MRSDRLLSILLTLQVRGRVSAAELAAMLEVSTRTIARDVSALSSAGVPVYTERGRHGGVALLPGFRTDVSGMTPDEAKALFVLLNGEAHHELGLGAAFASALRKILAALPEPQRAAADVVARRIIIDPRRWRLGPGVSDPDLRALQSAVFGDTRLRITYRSAGSAEGRTVIIDPYGLVSKAGVWYLVADHNSEPRLYRADRVLTADVEPEPVRRRPGQELADVWQVLQRRVARPEDGYVVLVAVEHETFWRFLNVHGGDLDDPDADLETTDEDGRHQVRLRLRSRAAGTALLSFGNDLEVLEPAELRADLGRHARRLSERYDLTTAATNESPPTAGTSTASRPWRTSDEQH